MKGQRSISTGDSDDRFILAHDLGTTGDKATLFDRLGKLVAVSFVPYETDYQPGNRAEQDPAAWWSAFCQASRQLLCAERSAAERIAAVSFSGQMMGCLPVDARGTPLARAIIWADQRAIGQAELIAEKAGFERVYRITGHRVSPGYSAAKILWLRDNQPEIFRNTHKFLHAKDYVVYRLTGAMVTDYSDASGMNLFDLESRTWSEEILDALDLDPALLPPPRPSTHIAGEIGEGVSEECGLVPGTPVVIGGGDGPCGAAGAGVISPGSAYAYLGSSGWIAVASERPLLDPKFRTCNFHHLDPRLITPTGPMQAAGASYQWVRDALCAQAVLAAQTSGVSPYDIMNLEAETVAPGSEGLLFLPYLMGERSPHWNPKARGVFFGLTMSHRRPHMVRAVVEGVVLNLRTVLLAFEEQGLSPREIRIVGGGAQGALWRKVMADAYQRPIVRTALMRESTSLGAAIAGGVGVGLFRDFAAAAEIVRVVDRTDPDPELKHVYDAAYELFVSVYEALVPAFEVRMDTGLERGRRA